MTKMAQNPAIPDPEPRDVLKYLLGRIYRTRNRQIQLCKSLDELMDWMTAPISGPNYSPTPRGPGHSDGTAAKMLMRMSEIEDSYRQQQAELAEAAQSVIDLVAFLPMDSLERTVCEMRHIRLMRWDDIAAQIPMSRRHVSRIYDGALDILLQSGDVQAAISAAAGEYIRWDMVCRASRSRWASEGTGAKNKVGDPTRKTKPEISAGN